MSAARIIVLLLLSTAAHAAADLSRLFESHFHTQYVAGRCGDNVRRFVNAAKAEGEESGKKSYLGKAYNDVTIVTR